MKLKIEINMDNAAFEAHGDATPRFRNLDEAARILRNLTTRWPGSNTEAGEEWSLRDCNGNTVGKAVVRR